MHRVGITRKEIVKCIERDGYLAWGIKSIHILLVFLYFSKASKSRRFSIQYFTLKR